jgi:hypothetical protein
VPGLSDVDRIIELRSYFDILGIRRAREWPEVPPGASWFRSRLYAPALQQVDDMAAPWMMTCTFDDGCSEEFAPLMLRITQKPITHDVVGFGGSIARTVLDGHRTYLDVLTVGRPTASLKWQELTPPGVHQHPADPGCLRAG